VRNSNNLNARTGSINLKKNKQQQQQKPCYWSVPHKKIFFWIFYYS